MSMAGVLPAVPHTALAGEPGERSEARASPAPAEEVSGGAPAAIAMARAHPPAECEEHEHRIAPNLSGGELLSLWDDFESAPREHAVFAHAAPASCAGGGGGAGPQRQQQHVHAPQPRRDAHHTQHGAALRGTGADREGEAHPGESTYGGECASSAPGCYNDGRLSCCPSPVHGQAHSPGAHGGGGDACGPNVFGGGCGGGYYVGGGACGELDSGAARFLVQRYLEGGDPSCAELHQSQHGLYSSHGGHGGHGCEGCGDYAHLDEPGYPPSSGGYGHGHCGYAHHAAHPQCSPLRGVSYGAPGLRYGLGTHGAELQRELQLQAQAHERALHEGHGGRQGGLPLWAVHHHMAAGGDAAGGAYLPRGCHLPQHGYYEYAQPGAPLLVARPLHAHPFAHPFAHPAAHSARYAHAGHAGAEGGYSEQACGCAYGTPLHAHQADAEDALGFARAQGAEIGPQGARTPQRGAQAGGQPDGLGGGGCCAQLDTSAGIDMRSGVVSCGLHAQVQGGCGGYGGCPMPLSPIGHAQQQHGSGYGGCGLPLSPMGHTHPGQQQLLHGPGGYYDGSGGHGCGCVGARLLRPPWAQQPHPWAHADDEFGAGGYALLDGGMGDHGGYGGGGGCYVDAGAGWREGGEPHGGHPAGCTFGLCAHAMPQAMGMRPLGQCEHAGAQPRSRSHSGSGSRPGSSRPVRARGKVDKGACERCGARMRGFGAGYCTSKACRLLMGGRPRPGAHGDPKGAPALPLMPARLVSQHATATS